MQLIELQCFAPVIIWGTLVEKTHIKFDIYERYEKMSFRNTYTLVDANGPIRMSIPLVNGRNQRIPYQMVEIDNSQRWQQLHWRTIVSAYNRSPWFEFYQLDLKQLYEQQYKTLVEWNSFATKWLLRQLKWRGQSEVSDQQFLLDFSEINHGEETKCHDVRNVFAPRNIGKLLSAPVVYNQVFQDRIGFIPYSSILDLLFCEGPNAKTILHQQAIANEKSWNELGKTGYLKNSKK